MKQVFPGINIQWPISKEILAGNKTVETRTYPLPAKYVGKELVMIETPGSKGDFLARGVALITFGPSYKYVSKKHFETEVALHLVNQESKWAWGAKPKWAWPILNVQLLKVKTIPERRGIVFTRNITVNL